ncbi:MAG: fumarylacetoacetate hydrolase family protein [Thermoguttaceae bacterium]|jgi:2-keto-4-pentenoate hydratase/2-oxohepta-3-ene-1,7-dioic acid hydratase in catechol pathway
MRLVTYASDRGPRVAALHQDGLVDLQQADPALPSCPKAFLAGGPEAVARAEAVLACGRPLPGPAGPLRLLPPIPSPEKILCIGLNYSDHARETGVQPPPEPAVFNKFPTAVAGHEAAIVLPRLSGQVDYEAELVVVIGRGGRHIPLAEAKSHVAAYCCGNDVSARDWQFHKPGGQWLAGKSFDTFAPCGPWLVTADEIPDPANLRIRLRLNGRMMQDSSTAQLIFSVEKLVSYVSDICTLAAGDLLFTGTPAGVGFARKPPVFLQPGDVVEVEIERIGVLRNPVVAEAP